MDRLPRTIFLAEKMIKPEKAATGPELLYCCELLAIFLLKKYGQQIGVTTIFLSDPSLKDLPAAPATPRKSIFGVCWGYRKIVGSKNSQKSWQVILSNTVLNWIKW